MDEAVRLSIEKMESGAGGPFGAVVVKEGAVIARGYNQVTMANDPTAHAEMVAIREACRALHHFQLTGCEVYASCEPCPMCLAALYWARPERVYFAATSNDAKEAGFDDDFIYRELGLPAASRKLRVEHKAHIGARGALILWKEKADKVPY